jgi:hypothetical protein
MMYWFMPWSLTRNGSIYSYVDESQLEFVQGLNFAGILCIILGCFAAGLKRLASGYVPALTRSLASPNVCRGGYILGSIGLAAWMTTIVSVGGLSVAFGTAYSGGWSDYGYVREATLTVLPALLLLMPSMLQEKWSSSLKAAVAAFSAPLLFQGLLGARRGPTFMIVAALGLAWYLYRARRPSLLKTLLGGAALGYLMLFLVLNRSEIYLGSHFNFEYDVTSMLVAPGEGNEYIYGAGSILNTEATGRFFWGRRYLAQILVRPIPRQIWPNKYADFGVPELEVNAGTGGDAAGSTLGWVGAPGSAPGLIADLWIEFSWLEFPVLFLIGYAYGRCWRNAIQKGGPWVLQYIILIAISLYLVMQTGEAVIFRFLIFSLPIWVIWRTASPGRQPRCQLDEGALHTVQG